MRIDKYLSNLKYGSRQAIKKMAHDGRIRVDDLVVQNSDFDIDPSQVTLSIDGEIIPFHHHVHLAVYKPKGYLSANKDAVLPCVTDLIGAPFDRYDLKMAGRLDLDAHGLMILTTDGHFVHNITHPKKHLMKTYEVIIDRSFTHEKAFAKGVVIQDGKSRDYIAKAVITQNSGDHVTMQIDSGKYHQVKRMFESLGYQVLDLKRIAIGNLQLGDMAPGTYRIIDKEILK